MTGLPNTAEGRSRFPKLDECAHFHYEHVEIGPLQVGVDLHALSRSEPFSVVKSAGGGVHARKWGEGEGGGIVFAGSGEFRIDRDALTLDNLIADYPRGRRRSEAVVDGV